MQVSKEEVAHKTLTLLGSLLVISFLAAVSISPGRAGSSEYVPAPLQEFMIDTTSLSNQILPSVASDGIRYLVVWQDYRSGESDIYGARVDTSGIVLDQPPIPICTTAGYQVSPSVSFLGSTYVVAWEDHRDADDCNIYFTRVDTSGTVLDPLGVLVSADSTDQWSPHLACGESNCLVAWLTCPTPDTSLICGARIDESGTILDSSSVEIDREHEDVFGNLFRQGEPHVAYGGAEYVVSWDVFNWKISGEICCALVDTAGSVIRGKILLVYGYNQQRPTGAFDGNNFLLVWNAWYSFWDVTGYRLSQAGDRLDPSVVVCIADSAQNEAFVGFDGNNYVVVWTDWRSIRSCDIYGARIDTSGVVLDSCGIELIDNRDYERRHPVIARGPTSQMLLVCDGFVPEPYDSNRIFAAVYHTVGIAETREPKTFAQHCQLLQNTPNPFSSMTTISYSIPIACHITLEVYDIAGRLVKTLADEVKDPGTHRAEWKTDEGSAGVYFYRLTAGDFQSTKKMVVID